MRFSQSIFLVVVLVLSISYNGLGQSFLERGIRSYNLGDLKQAERWFDWAIMADSADATVFLNRGMVRRSRKNVEGSYHDFQKSTELDSTNGDSFFLMALSAFHLNKYDVAIEGNSKAIELKSSYGSQAYLNRAQSLLRLGKNNKALEDLSSAINIKDSNLRQAHFDRGQVYMRLNEKKKALEDFKKVVELNPNNLQLTWDIGRISYEMEQYADALTYYSKTIDRIDKPQAQMLLVRGEVFEKLKNYEAAIQDYTRVIEMKQDLANAHYLRGQATARLGKSEEACIDWKKAAELGHQEAKGVIVYNCK
jgi:tetratricopeptide (TPR) repeat protein